MGFAWEDGSRMRFEAGGATLEARMHGPAPDRAPTIVLLHEGLGSMELWRDFPEALADATGMGVFAYSRRGYGHSDPAVLPRPIDYMEREAIDVLPEVLAASGFRRGILCGHSDGASIAALYCGNVQDHRVRGLVLMAPHFFPEPEGLKAIEDARAAYEERDLKARLARHHADVDNAFRGWNDAWLNPAFHGWNIGYALDEIRVPVLAIQGRDDPYGTLAQIREMEERLYSPLDTLILDGCRHAPFIERREETLAAVAEFAARLERIEAA